jgi:hypothetical protein
MELIKKLSTKTICGKITRADVPAKGVKPLFRVMGTAMGTKGGQSNYGDYLEDRRKRLGLESDTPRRPKYRRLTR